MNSLRNASRCFISRYYTEKNEQIHNNYILFLSITMIIATIFVIIWVQEGDQFVTVE